MKSEIKTIQSVQRAIDIINCIGNAEKKISLKEVSAELHLNINTARGLVQTLLVNGFLSKDEEQGTYSLGYEFLTKSKQVYQMQIQKIRNTAYPYMVKISEKYGVSCWLQISFYREIYTVETVEPSNSYYSYTPRSSANLPLHASASGKLRVAYMPENEREKVIKNISLDKLTPNTVTDPVEFKRIIHKVYAQEYALEIEEVDVGISSIAVPIFNIYGEMKGTLSIAAASQVVKTNLNLILRDLKKARNYIEDNSMH